jgi:hypothetical protein
VAEALVKSSKDILNVKNADAIILPVTKALKDGKSLTDILGCIHLYCYKVKSNFNALIVINKSDGDYFYANDFLNFDVLINNIKFKSPNKGQAHVMSGILLRGK